MSALQTWAIVLAAGRSRRMGATKQLLPILNKPAILHCLKAFHKAGFTRPVVVLAPDGEEVAGVLADRSATIAWNEHADCEMADSVRTGLAVCSSSCSGVVICPADYPLISPSTVSALTARHEEEPGKIVIPVHKGRKGHPVLFPRHLLTGLDAGLTLRDIISARPDSVIYRPVEDEGILLDMDTPSDYEALCRRMAEPGESCRS